MRHVPALRMDALNEAVHRQVMRRHAAASDPDGVRRVAATLAYLGLQPEPDTTDLLAVLFDRTRETLDRRIRAEPSMNGATDQKCRVRRAGSWPPSV
ncbi:hypothetical protein GCM10018962_15620 [Dactylosporangium matsuzakiense]|uniref:Uncharacterized protein n=1 Tax=Dactylosporangium matsuzakiense TaxID=53360 RepID=A0A9W6KRJ6_9ACTN|nr:hypothetical protein GCM10017581_071060 [Dactylosporangium matsuzakiense]